MILLLSKGETDEESFFFITLVSVLCMLLLASCVSTAESEDMSYLTPVKEELDPEEPYDAYHHGLFHNQTCTYSTTLRDGNTEYPVGRRLLPARRSSPMISR